MKTTVIYHSADFDGVLCREIARKFRHDVELIGWNFGDPLLSDKLLREPLYVLDLPLDKPFGIRFEDGWIARDNPIQSKDQRQIQPVDRWDSSNIIWIDHHASSIGTHPADIPGYRIDGVAACRLAWQWFTADHTDFVTQCNGLPSKEDFIERRVSEPLAVRLAGEYDIWDRRDPRAETFQYALRLGEPVWSVLLDPRHSDSEPLVGKMLFDGQIAQRYAQQIDADLVTHRSYQIEWEGLKWLVLNTGRFNSLTFAALDVPETGHDALLGYSFNGKYWTVSLYHARHRTDLDLSQIAIKHGGGGHRGACGFTCKQLPFA